MAADALAPCIARPSAAMVLTMQDNENFCNLSCLCLQIKQNTNTILYFLRNKVNWWSTGIYWEDQSHVLWSWDGETLQDWWVIYLASFFNTLLLTSWTQTKWITFSNTILPVMVLCGYPNQLRADCRLVPSQWETSLQSNAVSHWLGANLESVLQLPWLL